MNFNPVFFVPVMILLAVAGCDISTNDDKMITYNVGDHNTVRVEKTLLDDAVLIVLKVHNPGGEIEVIELQRPGQLPFISLPAPGQKLSAGDQVKMKFVTLSSQPGGHWLFFKVTNSVPSQ